MNKTAFSGMVLFALATLLLAAPAAGAADLTCNAVLYPEEEKTDVAFTTTDRAPKAKLSGTVRAQQGQSMIELDWSKLEPALLFGGDANCWVLWTITPDGTAQSLGEIPVRESRSGSATFSSPFKQFAMMVTAEPFPVVRRPSDLVAFVSGPTTSKKAKNSTFSFGGFREGMKRDAESIADLKYDDKTPVDLQQARKAIQLMDRYEAEKYAQAPARDARVALGQADDAYEGRVGKKGDVPELSRRTLSLAAEAVRAAVKQIEAQKAQDTEAARVAELAQKQAETEAEKAARLKTEADLADVQRQRKALEVEVARVKAEREQIQKDRDALAARLSGALGKVSATERTGRGLVVSLSGGILFETGKSALKTEAKVSLAKLAGILLMIPNANIQVEGHTDATGSEETNAKLSLARATSVMEFLEAQGVEKARMSAKGVAAAQPVAPNDTPDGRAKNRRVEIVVPE
ncbi:MAG TPA: OmpA family protein [Candidatus Polarisedimenticolaceae bacterium]